jgi:oxygen-independent coproporphyrinogen-3 oxidase
VTERRPFSLYVHIPFCTAKCTYCDFNSYAGQGSLMQPYAEAVAVEAALWSPYLAGRRVETVSFGGGTPSLLPLPQMQVIIDALHRCFEIEPGAEVTLEANPGTVDLLHLTGLRRLGFNRVSFGVQSFHDDELRTLDRIHDADAVDEAYGWAREAGFDNINLDLIYGLQWQSLEGWQLNLERALAMKPEHLSLYALTLEDGTPLTRDVERGRSLGPDLDLQADMFEWSLERMAAAGYLHYEVSNWSRPGRECRHNLVYWRNGDWLGLGAGAHSHLQGERFAAAASPSRYIALVQEQKAAGSRQPGRPSRSIPRPSTRTTDYASVSGPVDSVSTAPDMQLPVMAQVGMREPADRAREMSETVFLALRLREGLDLASFERRFAVDFNHVFGHALRETLELGLTELRDGRLRLRDDAVLLGDEAFMRFLSPTLK